MTTPREDAIEALLEQTFDSTWMTRPVEECREAIRAALGAEAETPPREDAIAAGQPCASHREQGFIYSVIGCPRCYPALGARAETPDPHDTPEPVTYEQAVSHWLASPETAEALARALGVVAIEDRDRVIAGDYRADTYEEHAARLLAAMREDQP